MPTKEEIERINYLYSGKSAWDELAEAADNGELIDLSKNLLSAYKEAIEVLRSVQRYIEGEPWDDTDISKILDKAPEDL